MSTSQLVAVAGHGLGSVVGHLKVLLDTELVRRTRSGRSVLYERTSVGDQLVGSTAGAGDDTARHATTAPREPERRR